MYNKDVDGKLIENKIKATISEFNQPNIIFFNFDNRKYFSHIYIYIYKRLKPRDKTFRLA